jgi:excisionase family DNA binding protein
MRKLLNVCEAARVLGLSAHTIRAWTASGRMPLVKLGKRTLFDEDELQRWVRERSLPARAAHERALTLRCDPAPEVSK